MAAAANRTSNPGVRAASASRAASAGTNPCRVIVRADLERVENVLLSCDAKQPISLAFPNHTIA